ncbi:PREDICTED: uncharacterized protein LOC108746691 [Trachymyrmex septentrionalis]|uniref:uncharacterized protein LOC108746691 n=1 Tax=Trachymyrmex septentrionalis TaxID=34720 RepID=UPI00084F65C5|nr:PREDICTED: uncharacterized protein LOC108746691 [Trachymyrmex septentrionalis]
MILENHRITIREVADDVGISFGSCQAIFSDVLGMKHVAAKFVPKLLNFDQKQRRVDIAQELLNEVNNDPELLKTVITGDETWPPYSPDMAPCDFFLFPKLKRTLKGQRFANIDEIKTESLKELNAIPKMPDLVVVQGLTLDRPWARGRLRHFP